MLLACEEPGAGSSLARRATPGRDEGEGQRAILGPTRDVLGCGAKRQTLQATVKIALICPIRLLIAQFKRKLCTLTENAAFLRNMPWALYLQLLYNIPRSASAVLMQIFMLITGLLIRISFKCRVRLAD